MDYVELCRQLVSAYGLELVVALQSVSCSLLGALVWAVRRMGRSITNSDGVRSISKVRGQRASTGARRGRTPANLITSPTRRKANDDGVSKEEQVAEVVQQQTHLPGIVERSQEVRSDRLEPSADGTDRAPASDGATGSGDGGGFGWRPRPKTD